MSQENQTNRLPLIGWREYLSLPTLGIDKIKAKIDTGAKTSALHAFNVEIINQDNQEIVKFEIHPIQKDNQTSVIATVKLWEYRAVKNSGGGVEKRPVIMTTVSIGNYEWEIALTLTNRDAMGFRMLLGRDAVKNRFLVDCGNSFLHN